MLMFIYKDCASIIFKFISIRGFGAMKILKHYLIRLSSFTAIAVMVVFSIQTIILNMINPTETATALSITSITPNIGSIDGGELVTITGDFGIPTDVPLNIVEISAGTNHTLALDSNGQIWAWELMVMVN